MFYRRRTSTPNSVVGFFTLAFLLLAVGCTSKEIRGPVDGPVYSESHLDFKKWNRKPDCCEAKGKKIAIASGGERASKIGVRIAREGGNVVDVAVATAFGLAVERPHSAGLGGGGFMTVYLTQPEKTVVFLDFRETAPHRASRDMFLDEKGNILPGFSQRGAFSVGTPGFVAGLWEAHQKWGKLPWWKVVQPAIQLARGGFRVYPSLAEKIEEKKSDFQQAPYTRQLFLRGGRPLRAGQWFVQEDLAKSLESIARDGKNAFYKGWIGEKIISSMKPYGGILSETDLEHYEIRMRTPIEWSWNGMNFYGAPPPSAGGVMMAQMMKVLAGYDLNKAKQTGGGYVHLLSEVMKRAYADRSRFVGDPDFVKISFGDLYSDDHAKDIQSDVNLSKSTPAKDIAPGDIRAEIHGTTHLSVMDAQGNAVSSTLTINGSFGSGIVVPGTGIVLNNEMDDFSIKPGTKNLYGLTGGDANAIAPGKRPVSSMSPTIVVKGGKPILALGGAGGSRIISNTFQVMMNYLLLQPGDLKKSLFAPRMHHQWLPDVLDLEEGFPETTTTYLKSLNNTLAPPKWIARVQAVAALPDGSLDAVFDPRDAGGVAAR